MDDVCKESEGFSELAFVSEHGAASTCVGTRLWAPAGGLEFAWSTPYMPVTPLCLSPAIVCSVGLKEQMNHSGPSREGSCALAHCIHALRAKGDIEKAKKSRECRIMEWKREVKQQHPSCQIMIESLPLVKRERPPTSRDSLERKLMYSDPHSDS